MEENQDNVACSPCEMPVRELTAYRRKRRVKPWLWMGVLAVCLGCMLLLWRGDGKDVGRSVLRAIREFSLAKGLPSLSWPNDDGTVSPEAETLTESEKWEDSREETETEASETDVTETDVTETEKSGSDTESEPSLDEFQTEKTLMDLSEAERGDGFLINYSSLMPDTDALLKKSFSHVLPLDSAAPVVLILHTHTSETYADAVDGELSHVYTCGVVAAGERLAYELNRSGVSTVHCTVIHDGENDEEPYESAEDTLRTMLHIYPNVRCVIDLHRLAELDGEGRALATGSPSVEGAAQIRLTVSSRGRMPMESLALALCLRGELNDNGKRLCMPVVLTDSSFNSGFTAYYLKIDVGGIGNTTAEASLAARHLALALATVLRK